MLNIGGGELLIILLVALIFLGPARLPEVARQMGQTVASLRSMARGFQSELEAAARPNPLPPARPVDTLETDPEQIGRAARDVGAASTGDEAESVSEGGPTDLRDETDEEE